MKKYYFLIFIILLLISHWVFNPYYPVEEEETIILEKSRIINPSYLAEGHLNVGVFHYFLIFDSKNAILFF